MAKKNKGGRPRKAASEKVRTPARQLGRVDEEAWQELQEAAKKEGKTFTEWAVAILLHAARRTKKRI